jgi:hypothetical protein
MPLGDVALQLLVLETGTVALGVERRQPFAEFALLPAQRIDCRRCRLLTLAPLGDAHFDRGDIGAHRLVPGGGLIQLGTARQHCELELLPLPVERGQRRAHALRLLALRLRFAEQRVDLVTHDVAPAQTLRTLDLQPFDVFFHRDDLYRQLVRSLSERAHRFLRHRDGECDLIELDTHLGQLRAGRLRRAAQMLDLAPACQDLLFDRAIAATGDHAARIDDITFRRDQRDADPILPPQADGGAEIGHQHHFAEQRLRDVAVLVVHAHQVHQPPRCAIQLRHGGEIRHARLQRNEAAPSGRFLAQPIDGLRAVFFAAHDHVLQAIAEHRRHCPLVLLRDIDDVGHHAQHAVGMLLGAHDRAHAALKAFVVRLDLRQRLLTRACLQKCPLELERLALGAPARFRQRAQLVGARFLRPGRRRQLAAQAVEVGAARHELRIDIGAALLERRFFVAQLVELTRHFFGAPFQRGGAVARFDFTRDVVDQRALRRLERRLPLAQRRTQRVELGDTAAQLTLVDDEMLGGGRALLIGLLQALRSQRRGSARRLGVVGQPRHAARPLVALLDEHRDALADALALGLEHGEVLAAHRVLLLGGIQGGRCLLLVALALEQRAAQPLDLRSQRGAPGVDLRQLPPQSAPLTADHAQLELAQFGDDALVHLGLLGLAFEILRLALDLAQDVGHTREILACALHAPFRRQLAAAVEGRARGFFDEEASILRLGVDELLDAPLLDDRVRLAADAGAEKELRDVLQPARRPVDEVLRLTRAIVAARHGDLGQIADMRR